MTVEKFQELYQLSNMEADEVTKSMLLVQSYTGLTEEQILKMSPKKFNKLCSVIVKEFDILKNKLDNAKPIELVKVNGNWYRFNYDISKKPHNAGTYVEIATFNEDIIGNLHKIMATIVTPLRWSWKGLVPTEREHPDISEDMLQLDFKAAYQAAVFFYVVFKESMQNLTTYLVAEIPTEKRTEFHKAWMAFINTSDGFTLPKWYQNWKASNLKEYGISLQDNF